jgi:hypothetical protein
MPAVSAVSVRYTVTIFAVRAAAAYPVCAGLPRVLDDDIVGVLVLLFCIAFGKEGSGIPSLSSRVGSFAIVAGETFSRSTTELFKSAIIGVAKLPCNREAVIDSVSV